MATPAEVVASAFAQAQSYASSAQTSLTGFTGALNGAVYAPPSLNLNWNSITAPSIPTLPSLPVMPSIAFTGPTAPSSLALIAPTISLDEFTENAPVVNLPAAPVVAYGAAPTIPSIGVVAIPDAPVLVLPDTPTFLAMGTPSFAGIDLHADYLTKLEDIPVLDLLSPTPYYYAPGAEYASSLLDTLKARLIERMAGGTGLAPAVEQAVWDRARSRETSIALANESEIMRSSEAFGFQLPTGTLAAQLREAQQNYFGKLSGLSRDISIKQAELEQENLKQTISQGMELEGRLIDYSYKLEQLTFDAAKAAADNAVQIYNAEVEQYKALLSAYQTYAAVYKTVIDSEMVKVEVYKAELQGEMTKAQVNVSLVSQYKATIEANMAQVDIYKAQIGAANTLVQLEQTKVSAAGEQIRAYAAQVNAETAKVEAYKATVQAEATKVEIYRVKAVAYSAVVGAQADKARLELGRYTALYQAKAAEFDGYRARVGAESERIRALGLQSSALLDGYKASAAAIEAESGMHTKIWETEIKNYEAGVSVALQTGKINTDAIIATNNARLDAAKVGAQVYAQLTSSAYSMVNASAGVSASSGMTVGYSYGNDTVSAAPTITTI